MAIHKDVEIKITGSVCEDQPDNTYDIILAKLKVVCAEYGLEIEEDYDFNQS